MTQTGMPTRRLGDTGMDLTTVGFGAWAIGGSGWKWAWGAQDDAESVAAIRRAVELGVNWIDTAPMYGLGHSEEIIGQAIADMPESERPYVFTKAGLIWDPERPTAAPRKIMRAESVRREVDASLRRLGVERIDFYQVHWPGDGALLDWAAPDAVAGADRYATPLAEYWQTMADLKREGKVRAIGLSNHGTAQLAAAEQVAHIDGIQPQFSLLHRQAAPELAWAAARTTGAIVYQPLHSGLLTGAFSTERVAALPDDDWRKESAEFTSELGPNLALVDALRPVAGRHGVPVGAVAIAWTLAWPGVVGAIVGARRPAQTADWPQAASLELTPADLAEIAAALTGTGAGTGPVQP